MSKGDKLTLTPTLTPTLLTSEAKYGDDGCRYYTVFWTATGDLEATATATEGHVVDLLIRQDVSTYGVTFSVASCDISEDYGKILDVLPEHTTNKAKTVKHYAIDSIHSHGTLDPESVHPDGKVHLFQIVTRLAPPTSQTPTSPPSPTLSTLIGCWKTIIATIEGTHPHYHGCRAFGPKLRQTIFGLASTNKDLLTVSGIRYLGIKPPS
jgi:hypothetical protein